MKLKGTLTVCWILVLFIVVLTAATSVPLSSAHGNLRHVGVATTAYAVDYGRPRASFGSGDLPTLPADFFYPGSDPFTGEVEVCDGKDNDCDGVIEDGIPSGTFAFEATADSAVFVFDEPTGLRLRSVAPIEVTGTQAAQMFDVFFDVDLAPDPGGTTGGQMRLVPGQPGGNFIVDSFFDVSYEIEFVAPGGKPGDPGNRNGGGSATLTLQDPPDTIPAELLVDAIGEPDLLIPGNDGQSFRPFLFASNGGGLYRPLQSVPEPATAVLAVLAGLACLGLRRR